MRIAPIRSWSPWKAAAFFGRVAYFGLSVVVLTAIGLRDPSLEAAFLTSLGIGLMAQLVLGPLQ